ncbi:MAG: protein translocase subunit SecD [Deltaproteobacteria bacterium]|nr:protein translocase subunit SecD [Deltaproteobacteria bacterium]
MSRWWYTKLILILALGIGAFVSVWPSLESMAGLKAPPWVKEHVKARINRGLDLRGGLRLVYTVQVDEAIRDKRDRFADELRAKVGTALGIHKGDAPLTNDEQKAISEKLTIERIEHNKLLLRFKDVADVPKVNDDLLGPMKEELLLYRPGDPAVVGFKVRTEVENAIRERAVGQAKKTVENRVDELGLREAAITTRDEDIIIEVPGEDEKTFEEIKAIVSQTARLEFKIVDDEADFFGKVNEYEHPLPEGATMQNELAPAGVSASGSVKQTPSHFVRLVKKPEESQQDALKRFKTWIATLGVPDDHQVAFGEFEDIDAVTGKRKPVGWRTYYLFRRADVTGEYITDAQVASDTNKGPQVEYYVAITFSPTGADRFKMITGANVKRRFAILLDDKVDSAPVIQSEIGGGHASITLGSFADKREQLDAAKKLELVLRAGALPAPIEKSNEQRIGASLGSDAIKQGLKGALLGAGLVLVFMVIYYHWSGVVANGAVLFNLLLQLAALALFGASMTLPGIAGLALTIGMAVDANVLINERIREELREGRSPRAAVETGYAKAFAAIFDGHVTTFIGGLLLMQYGTGPIKGFAVTLIIGIVASLFTAVVCTRLVFDWWVLGRRVKKLSVG